MNFNSNFIRFVDIFKFYEDSISHLVNEPSSDEAWNPPCNWDGPEVVLYRSFDKSDGLDFMEGTQQMNIVPLVSGKVIVKLGYLLSY